MNNNIFEQIRWCIFAINAIFVVANGYWPSQKNLRCAYESCVCTGTLAHSIIERENHSSGSILMSYRITRKTRRGCLERKNKQEKMDGKIWYQSGYGLRIAISNLVTALTIQHFRKMLCEDNVRISMYVKRLPKFDIS